MKRPFASVAIRTNIAPEVRERFLAKVSIAGPDDCWEWHGSRTSQGYGRFRFNGSSTTAQRVAYALFVGDLAAGLTVDHLCDVRYCVNPRHLEAVPHRVNVLRSNGVCANHARQTHCAQGHALALYDGPNHRQRYCPTCKREKGREWMRRHRGSDPARYRV